MDRRIFPKSVAGVFGAFLTSKIIHVDLSNNIKASKWIVPVTQLKPETPTTIDQIKKWLKFFNTIHSESLSVPGGGDFIYYVPRGYILRGFTIYNFDFDEIIFEINNLYLLRMPKGGGDAITPMLDNFSTFWFDDPPSIGINLTEATDARILFVNAKRGIGVITLHKTGIMPFE